MKPHVTFDTLEFADELKKGGFDQKQAETLTKANVKAFNQIFEDKDLATRSDLNQYLLQLKLELQGFIGKMIVGSFTILCGIQVLFHFFPGK
jgi:hypothetical protein